MMRWIKCQDQKPKDFFANKLGYEIALEGILIGVLTLVAYLIGSKQDHIVGQTMAFFHFI